MCVAKHACPRARAETPRNGTVLSGRSAPESRELLRPAFTSRRAREKTREKEEMLQEVMEEQKQKDKIVKMAVGVDLHPEMVPQMSTEGGIAHLQYRGYAGLGSR